MGIRAWILPAAMMVLIAALPSSKACSCFYSHPQSFFCSTDIVMKGKFQNEAVWNSSTDPKISYKGYKLMAVEVYKGDISQSILLVSSLAGTSCEYIHNADNFNKDYLITVIKGSNTFYVNGCTFIKLWSELSSAQIKGFRGDYGKQCSCEVTPCFWLPCSTTEKQCAFDGQESQEWNQICAQNEQGTCAWKAME